jgi:hypothetical protein
VVWFSVLGRFAEKKSLTAKNAKDSQRTQSKSLGPNGKLHHSLICGCARGDYLPGSLPGVTISKSLQELFGALQVREHSFFRLELR